MRIVQEVLTNVIKHAAARLGGAVDIQSRPGEGTSVRLRLPIRR